MGQAKSIHVEIDKSSGFCFGVVNAISQAEKELQSQERLYCIGEIVHNNMEVERLKSLGLQTISHSDLDKLQGSKVLFRAHGEPPETYRKALEKGLNIIDASCPVVLKLQVKVREAWQRMEQVGGQVVIYGKKGHAEVLGLVGQTQGNAMVIERIEDINNLDFAKPIELFAQTTMSADEYKKISNEIGQRTEAASNSRNTFHAYNSICGQVANRKDELKTFASKFDAVAFVSGKNSSNGKMLYEVCKQVNPNTYFISSTLELKPHWFQSVNRVGVCGATSTPLWLMEEVAAWIRANG